MASKKIVTIAGVAEGKQLSPVPTEDNVSPADRVRALLSGSLSEELYHVCSPGRLLADSMESVDASRSLISINCHCHFILSTIYMSKYSRDPDIVYGASTSSPGWTYFAIPA